VKSSYKTKIATSLHYGLVLASGLLQAFAAVSLRKLTINSMILAVNGNFCLLAALH
jgi:hypothetical protein